MNLKIAGYLHCCPNMQIFQMWTNFESFQLLYLFPLIPHMFSVGYESKHIFFSCWILVRGKSWYSNQLLVLLKSKKDWVVGLNLINIIMPYP